MVTFQREPLFQVASDIDALIALNQQETGEHDMVLDPDWEQYRALESSGALFTVTARNGEELIGYAVFIVWQHRHYRRELLGANDLVFLRADHRKGSAGVRLIQESKRLLKDAGVTFVTFHAKPGSTLSKLLERLDCQSMEIVHGQKL